nr:F-box domain containing protein [Pandoravirus belohorizontensis]
MCTIGNLPDEVLVDVFDRLDCADLYAGAGAVSVRWKGIAADVMARAEPVCARRARAADPAHVDYVGPYITNLVGDAAADWRLYAHDPQCRYRGHACLCAARNDRIAVLDVLCRMLGHPWVPAVCVEAASRGRLGILAYAATHKHPYDQGACEAAAAAAKQRVVLDWLWESHPPTRASADRAAESGDIALLRLLQARRCPRGESTMAAAARGGHVDVVQWLMRHRCPWDATAILAAARVGSVDVLRLLLAHYEGRIVAAHAIQAAVAGGDVVCVDLLWARCLGGDDDIVDPAVGQTKAPTAAGRGRAKIYTAHGDVTRDRANESNRDIVALYGPRWMVLAARHGDVAMLDRLCSRGCAPTSKATAAAAGAGNMGALVYLRRCGCPWDAQATAAAAAHGRLDVLDYLYRHGCPWDATTCTAAAGAGHLECLAYAHCRGCPWDRQVYVAALGHGHVHILEYAHQQDCPRDRTVCRAAVAAAAVAGPASDAVRFTRQEVCRHRAGRCDLKPKVGRRRTGPASPVPFFPSLLFSLYIFFKFLFFFK